MSAEDSLRASYALTAPVCAAAGIDARLGRQVYFIGASAALAAVVGALPDKPTALDILAALAAANAAAAKLGSAL